MIQKSRPLKPLRWICLHWTRMVSKEIDIGYSFWQRVLEKIPFVMYWTYIDAGLAVVLCHWKATSSLMTFLFTNCSQAGLWRSCTFLGHSAYAAACLQSMSCLFCCSKYMAMARASWLRLLDPLYSYKNSRQPGSPGQINSFQFYWR